MRFCRISRAALVILLILSYSLTACAVTAEPEPAARPTTVTAAHPTMTLTLTRSPQLSPMLAQPTVTAATATTSATATPDLRPGAVTGNLCYPSSKPPPMTLYLKNTVTGDITAIDIAPGQTTFKVAVPPGAYVAYAHTVGTELAGGYTQISTCEDCGHDLRPFDVEPGATADGIDLCDWYDPPRIEFDPAVQNGASVLVTTLQNMNVFSSPTLASLDLAIVPPRTTVEAVARTADGAWLQAEFPHTGPAWIFAPLTQVKGQPGILPVATPGPALPTVEKKSLPKTRSRFVPATWITGYNATIVHFKGHIRDEAGHPVNGFSVLLDNGTWSVLSHPTGASRHYPDVEDGAWDLVIANAADAAGWWALTVVSYDCPDFETGFNAQCKQFTPLSDTEVVGIVYPDGNVIDADWICRSGCDQGLYVEPYRRP